MDRSILQELTKNGAVMDLVVVTLLRINSVQTKESMAKALFNVMTRAEFRAEMVLQQDILAAHIELAKIDSLELLELCVRSIYNITCETPTYADKLQSLGVPTILVARATSSTSIQVRRFRFRPWSIFSLCFFYQVHLSDTITFDCLRQGAKPSTAIKLLCGMALANISFHKALAAELAFDRKVTIYCISIVGSYEPHHSPLNFVCMR